MSIKEKNDRRRIRTKKRKKNKNKKKRKMEMEKSRMECFWKVQRNVPRQAPSYESKKKGL